MKLWLTAAEIADLALPGLPATKRNINALAEQSGWADRKGLCRPRSRSGGGMEYHLDILPPQARQAYVARFVPQPVPVETAAAAEAEPAAVSLRDDAAEARDARLAILTVADRIFNEAKLPRLHADLLCVADYEACRLPMPEWVRKQVPRLTLRSLQRWRAAKASGQTTRLAVDRGAARRGSGVLDQANDGQVRIFILALISRQPHLSADHVRELVIAKFGETLTVTRAGGIVKTVPVPPIRTIQVTLATWKVTEKVALTALTNPDAFKSRYKLAGSNTDTTVSRLNEVWQIDASPMDALCVDGRHSVYAAIDVYSRRMVLYVSRTPRAQAVGLLLRKALLAWGVPERIKTDNGSDFTAKASERLFLSLGIERELSPAFTPEAKAFVERAIGTFQRDLGPLLPGFIGHSVADRKVIEARKAFAQRLGETDERGCGGRISGRRWYRRHRRDGGKGNPRSDQLRSRDGRGPQGHRRHHAGAVRRPGAHHSEGRRGYGHRQGADGAARG
ncbi:DDE-type integrase/transposase/recombinase [Methylorubrum populi]